MTRTTIFTIALALLGLAQSGLSSSFEVAVKRGNTQICSAYIVGDFWALTIKDCISYQKSQFLKLEDLQSGNAYQVVQIEDTSESDKFSHLDVAMLKVDKTMLNQGRTCISPDMPEEGSKLTQFGSKLKSTVTEYEDCERIFGNKTGTFCTKEEKRINPSLGLFDNGMLAGISLWSEYHSTYSISTAYLTNWVLDTMSEIKQ